MSNPQKVVITLAHKSGLIKDANVMSLYFDRGTAPASTDYDNLKTVIQNFFGVTPTGGINTVGSFLAACIQSATTGHSIKWYNIPASRGSLGSPVATRSFTIGSVGATSLPSEVAVCLSYQRAYGTDVEFGASGVRPRARDRGRIYLGPLTTGSTVLDATTKEARVASQMQTDVTLSAKQQFGTAALAQNWSWIHFSPTEWSWDAVTGLWMDDAYDTQRRRGVLPTTKVSQSV